MNNVLRVGLYERVSTQEQALHGYSIETQKATLEEHCKEKGYKIVGHYTDEGISGAKPPLKRPALKQLLDDVKAGKIDIIIFTKLDRWFRSIEQYYKVQEILERHNVVWQAVLEDYNTATADGRLKVNIMLSVAANERERTSERIKVVFEHKRKNKIASFGGDVTTLGYIKQMDENGIPRLVKDPETRHIVEEFWEMMIKYHNITKVSQYLNNKYNLSREWGTWQRMKNNELYYGEYRGVKGFCEPYITKEEWSLIQSRPNIRKAQKNRIYLFTGLIKCPSCGRKLSSRVSERNGKVKYVGYKCSKGLYGLCDYKVSVSEKTIEEYLLERLDSILKRKIDKIESERAERKKAPKTDVTKLKERLRKLNVMYMNGTLDDDEYLTQTSELKALIAGAEQETPVIERDLTPLKKLLKTDWKSLYETLDRERKRAFWRGILDEIVVEGREIKEIIVLGEHG